MFFEIAYLAKYSLEILEIVNTHTFSSTYTQLYCVKYVIKLISLVTFFSLITDSNNFGT